MWLLGLFVGIGRTSGEAARGSDACVVEDGLGMLIAALQEFAASPKPETVEAVVSDAAPAS